MMIGTIYILVAMTYPWGPKEFNSETWREGHGTWTSTYEAFDNDKSVLSNTGRDVAKGVLALEVLKLYGLPNNTC